METSLKREIIKVIKKYRPNRYELENALREAKRENSIREILGPAVKRPPRKLPKLPSMNDIKKLLDVMEKDGNIKFKLMGKMFLYTGLRNTEMVHIRTSDINLDENRIFINQGKGGKDRYTFIFKEIRDTLVMYLVSNKPGVYLFENKFGKPYSERWIRKIFQIYCKQAKLPRIHPHMLRHLFITYLTKCGWTDEQIMLLSGHSSKVSLKIYQHLALPDVEEKYQQDIREMGL